VDATHGYSANLWSAVITQYVKALRVRRLVFEAGALFAGRTPFTSALVAGGVTTKASEDLSQKCDKYKAIMAEEILPFIRDEYIPIALALGALYGDWENASNTAPFKEGPASGGLPAAWNLPGKGYGAGLETFLSWGGYPNLDDSVVFKGGWTNDAGATAVNKLIETKGDVDDAIALVQQHLKESIASSRVANYNDEFGDVTELEAYPGEVTRTQPDRESGYSYSKAPRFAEKPREVGPLARMIIGGLYNVGDTVFDSLDAGLQAYDSSLGAKFATDYYLADVGGGLGLRADRISADLAVALLREDPAGTVPLATVYVAALDATVNYNQIAAAIQPGGALADLGLDTLEKVMEFIQVEGAGRATVHGAIVNYIAGVKCGLSTMDRLRARALESLYLILNVTQIAPAGKGIGAAGWINQLKEIANTKETACRQLPVPVGVRKGFGCVEAPRGSLSHFSTIENGKIAAYQCVVPYTWNISPRDVDGVAGPTEAAMVDIPFVAHTTSVQPFATSTVGTVTAIGCVEALRVAQSFDPCVACAVH